MTDNKYTGMIIEDKTAKCFQDRIEINSTGDVVEFSFVKVHSKDNTVRDELFAIGTKDNEVWITKENAQQLLDFLQKNL